MIQVGDVICSHYDAAGEPQNEFWVTRLDPIMGLPLGTNVIVPMPWTFTQAIKVCSATNT